MSSTPRVWTPDDTVALAHISALALAPDASAAVLTVTHSDLANRAQPFRTRLFLARPPRDGAPLACEALALGEEACFAPAWSPGGARIGFLRATEGVTRVWLVDSSGGDARCLTPPHHDVTAFAWAPDGGALAYCATESNGVGPPRLFVVQQGAPGEPLALTSTELYVGGVDGSEALAWWPDGSGVVFAASRGTRHADWPTQRVAEVDLATRTVRTLGDPDEVALGPKVSPDGQTVAYIRLDDPCWEWSSTVHLVGRDGTRRALAATPDRRVGLLGWSAAGDSVLVLEQAGTAQRVYTLPSSGEAPQVLLELEGSLGAVSLNESRTALAYVADFNHRPAEAYLYTFGAASPVCLSAFNARFAAIPTGTTELCRFSSSNGHVIDGLLTRPNDRDAAGPLPLVVSLHGGPSDAWSQSFVGRETQFGPLASLVAEGYAVLRCNVCGSTGYGPDFRRATAGAWGEQDAADVLAGIEALAARGLIDPDRVGLIGWSYGGFLAACLLSQSGRFRAAVVGAAMTDLVGYALGTDAPESIEAAFGGPLWESAARLLACSPAIRANRIRTPTLVVHGKLDRRVPVAQSIHFHRALQRVGCASELLVYPEVGHHPADPRVRRHLMRSMLDWFARYLPTAP